MSFAQVARSQYDYLQSMMDAQTQHIRLVTIRLHGEDAWKQIEQELTVASASTLVVVPPVPVPVPSTEVKKRRRASSTTTHTCGYEGCLVRPVFNFVDEDGKGKYCSKHKLPGMVDCRLIGKEAKKAKAETEQPMKQHSDSEESESEPEPEPEPEPVVVPEPVPVRKLVKAKKAQAPVAAAPVAAVAPVVPRVAAAPVAAAAPVPAAAPVVPRVASVSASASVPQLEPGQMCEWFGLSKLMKTGKKHTLDTTQRYMVDATGRVFEYERYTNDQRRILVGICVPDKHTRACMWPLSEQYAPIEIEDSDEEEEDYDEDEMEEEEEDN